MAATRATWATPGLQRAQALLRLSPERDGFEVYRIGPTFSAGLYGEGMDYLCPACQGPVVLGDRARRFYTRRVGTQWRERMGHVVHERCWLKARTAQGLDNLLRGRTA